MDLSEAILSLMISLRPDSPWKESYKTTAASIASASLKAPLFGGEDGPAKTAYLLVAVAEFESGFQPDAEGDCDKTDPKTKTCVKGSTPHSFCLLQISETNFKGMGTTRSEIQSSVDVCVTVGLRMMHRSFTSCRSYPLEERLRWYAGGGPVCTVNDDAGKKSKHRVNRALWLFRERSPAYLSEKTAP